MKFSNTLPPGSASAKAIVKKVPLPEVEVQYFPCNPRGHVVLQDSIMGAWKEVLYLLSRFGHRVP